MMFKPGDLVMVVKPMPCCGNGKTIGKPFIVREIRTAMTPRCQYCGVVSHSIDLAMTDEVGARGLPIGRQLSRLIKIDPLTEQDKTETLQEITA
jgi:hypothetical protein